MQRMPLPAPRSQGDEKGHKVFGSGMSDAPAAERQVLLCRGTMAKRQLDDRDFSLWKGEQERDPHPMVIATARIFRIRYASPP